MGIDFRGKGYNRRVRIGKRTVKDGEAVAVWDQYGRHTEVIGPALQRLWWSTIRFLEHHIAGSEQYLKVQKRDGTIEYVRGPASLFENPVYHNSVTVEKAIAVPDAKSYIVVSKSSAEASSSASSAGSVANSRTIVNGPTTFFPEPTDRVHKFEWSDAESGPLSKDKFVLSLRTPLVRSLKSEVRDAHGHAATLSLSLRGTVVGVEEALSIKDPVSGLDSLFQSMVAAAMAKCDFAKRGTSLLVGVQEALAMDTFTDKLRTGMKESCAIDFVSLTVVSVKPSEELEKVHRKEDDLANAKVAEQLAAMSLDAAVSRQQQEQKLQEAKQKHELQLEQERQQAARANDDLQDQRRIAYLKELRNLNVDLTEYLVSSVRHTELEGPPVVDKKKKGWGCWAP